MNVLINWQARRGMGSIIRKAAQRPIVNKEVLQRSTAQVGGSVKSLNINTVLYNNRMVGGKNNIVAPKA